MADELQRAWKVLQSEWREANQAARAERAVVTLAYADALDGEGPGPTPHQLKVADRLEQLADVLAAELDRLVMGAPAD